MTEHKAESDALCPSCAADVHTGCSGRVGGRFCRCRMRHGVYPPAATVESMRRVAPVIPPEQESAR